MGESTYGCCPRARSVALQPRQFPISNVCRTRIVYDRKAAGPACYGSFTYAQSPFAPVPEVLHTEGEYATQRVYKEFFHVWRGHSRSVCDSSGWLGGNIAAASTSAPVTSTDLSMDSSAVMSFQATISVDNRGSVLPDALNTGDALERCGQVPQKMEALIAKDGKDGEIEVSANPSAVGDCSCKSSSMGMIKYSTRLQRRHFRPSTVRWTTSKALEMQVNKLFEEVLQSEFVERMKGHLDSILQSFRNSEDLILIEQQAVIGLEEKQKRIAYHHCQPIPFMEEYMVLKFNH